MEKEFLCTGISKSNGLMGYKETSWSVICQIKPEPDDWHALQRKTWWSVKKKLKYSFMTYSCRQSILSLLCVGGNKKKKIIARPRQLHGTVSNNNLYLIKKRHYKKRKHHLSKSATGGWGPSNLCCLIEYHIDDFIEHIWQIWLPEMAENLKGVRMPPSC